MASSTYMRLKLRDLPEIMLKQHNLEAKATKESYVHVEIRYIPQAGLIAQQLIKQRMNKMCYKQIDITLVFWMHEWCPIYFLLCVNDFGLKYFVKQHADHLMSVLREHFKISRDYKVKCYLGLYIYWDNNNCKLHLSMLACVADALTRFRHKHPCKPHDQPYPHIKPTYDVKSQYAESVDVSSPLSKEDLKIAQEVTGTFLYYSR